MAEAVRVHGAGYGTWLGLRRLMRCLPFGGYGIDPVPHER
jgi:putative component of membrane protein insertase Oxa1/YidC/SpoIIIJ protein YidD